jgi:hypothetical protein
MLQIRLILILTSAVYTCALTAQTQPEIQWSKPYKINPSYRLYQVVGDSSEAYVYFEKQAMTLFKGPRQSVLVDHHSKSTGTERLQDLSLQYKKKQMRLAEVQINNGQLYNLSTFYNEGQRKRYLFVQQAHRVKMTPTGKPEILTDVTVNNLDQGQFHMEFAPDSSRMVVIADDGAKSKEKARIKVHVFNSSFEPLWQRQITLPYAGDEFDIKDVAVDLQGRVFVLGIRDPGGSFLRPEREPTFEYVLLMFSEDGTDQNRTAIRAKDRFINDLVLAPQPDGNMRLVGLFSSDRRQNVRGVYSALFDTYSNQLLDPTYQNFSFDIRTKDLGYIGRKRADRTESESDEERMAELSNYHIERTHRLADGSLVLLAEQQIIDTRTQYDAMGRWRTVTMYYYNDIVVFKISPQGQLEWTSVVPKTQVQVSNYGQLGFSSFDMAEGLFILFNDSESGYMTNTNSVALVQIDLLDGTVLAHTDLTQGMRRPMIMSRTVFRQDMHELVVPVLIGQEYRVARIQLSGSVMKAQ